ncbi:MAG: hypothetical protein GY842_25270 [bacterium]|nr:hypothetical protein [bacterium]
MTMTSEIMIDALRRVREVHPETDSVSFTVRVRGDETLRHDASVTNEDDLGGGIVLGYGDTPEASLVALCARLQELRDARRIRTLCVVCAATGTETVGDVTTGDGMMCREHALEWLQSERQAADQSVGPCEVKS